MKKISILISFIAIILLLIFMGICTYAYLTKDERVHDKVIDNSKKFDDGIIVKFNDTSNLSLINSNSNDNLIKEFSIENRSNKDIYYDISLKNVVNNFNSKEDLIYNLESDNNGANRENSILPNKDDLIASSIRINKNEKQNYKLIISYNTKDENNLNKTFSSNIVLSPSNDINYNSYSLLGHIINNSKGYFKKIDGDGIYYTNSSINGKTIYFYRGSNNLNNNIILGNNCYKIVRTTIDDGIRIIFNGKYENNICSNNKILDEKSEFNKKANYNAYVGFMYGDASSDNYINEHSNKNSSSIKEKLELFYKNNLMNIDNKISRSSIYCNNRKTSEFVKKNVVYGVLGFSTNNTGYISYTNKSYTVDCNNLNDRLTITHDNGSKVLNYPIGLITVDELRLSGFELENNYLKTKDSYWTMSPAYFNGRDAYNFIANNKFTEAKVDSISGIRPVITLDKSVIIKSGDGSENNPFQLK